MKKIFIILFVLVMSLSIVSCKKKNKITDDDVTEILFALKDAEVSLKVGDTYTVNPTIEGVSDTSFSIESDNQKVVSISGKTITAVSAGTANLTLKLTADQTKTATLKVVVTEDAVEDKLEISCKTSAKVGDTFDITVTTNVEGAVTYESSDAAVVSVDENGHVTANAAGTATITVSVGNLSKTATITVTQDQTKSLTISGPAEIYVGKSGAVKCALVGLEGKPTYESSDTSIATVSVGGVVKGIAAGTVTITASLDGYSDSMEIEILAQPSITFTNAPEYLAIGSTLQLEYTLENCAPDTEVQFTGNNDSVATINATGLVTAKAVGKMRVTAQIGSFKFYLNIEVVQPTITITNKPDALYVDTPFTIEYETEYLEGAPTFKSSSTSLATVDENGVVTPLGLGTVTITVTHGSVSDSFTVKIKATQVVVTYKFNGGYSEELLAASATTEPCLEINSYNQSNGNFWGRYASDVFIGDKSNDPKATFSDRIYIGKNKDNGIYEVLMITRSGPSLASADWPENFEYVITISNSYSNTALGRAYYAYMQPLVGRINVGDMVAFDGDITTATETNSIKTYFFSSVPDNDTMNVVVDEDTKLIAPGQLGFKFLGWFDPNDVQVTSLQSLARSTTLTAKWEELNPVTSIDVTAIVDELIDGETFQVEAKVLPDDAYFQSLFYESSNTDIFTVSSTGLLTAVNAGVATLTIHDYLNKVKYTKEITVYPVSSIDITFSEVYVGYLGVDEEITITPKAYGKGLESATFNFGSSNPSIASIDSNGKIHALSVGVATITISIPDTSINLTVLISVSQYSAGATIDNLVKLLAEANFGHVEMGNVSLYNDGHERYYVPVYGSVNKFLFDKFEVNEKYYTTSENNPNNHKDRRATDPIEFVCVHDTATLTGTVESIASGMSSGETSIHYTVGNDAIFGVVPEKYIAYHAGDGTGTVFEWSNAGVPATDTFHNPKFDMVKGDDNKWYLTINGTKSTIVLPTGSISSPSAKYLTRLGPTWKVVDGVYYIGTTWWSKDYGYISSKGGNNDSIGIEMNVNLSSDIYDTWQRTAQLVVDILIRNNLDRTRVKMHNTFSGKNCPQCIISAGNWDMFMEFVDLRYEIMTKYKDAEISIVSNNPDIVDNTGRVYNPPKTTQTVSYDLTVKFAGETRTITLFSVVSGTTTWEQWEGAYPASRIWNNGHFSLV